MTRYTLVVDQLPPPIIIVHGGAGAYLKTTTAAQRNKRGDTMAAIAEQSYAAFAAGGALGAVSAAMHALEADPSFNAGYGSRLQRDGVARLSAALMDGRASRMSAVYNVRGCKHPTALARALQEAGDRNLDGEGAALLMKRLGIEPSDVRTASNIARHQKLLTEGDRADREAAIGDADDEDLERARIARTPMPRDFESPAEPAQTQENQPADENQPAQENQPAKQPDLPDEQERYGTVGAAAIDSDGQLWASTSTGGRGHEAVGRISDSPTPAGNYACPAVALSATGFGEQIIDLNLCGRIATRMLDGASLEQALARTFDEVADFGGLLGVIAVSAAGEVGYAHTTEACGVAWLGSNGKLHIDQHGRSS